MSDPRYICIHGHFYQPPRENPWLEAIELQDSAYPFHDWNERITDECYRPNARSRMLDDDGRIVQIVNNYARMSFNFGPTILSWFQEHAPDVHDAIVEADRLSMERFSGNGSALAQAYNHAILPLCNDRDRATQIRWGIRDFERRFNRRPQGMWLPETAANTATLEALAEQDIIFTILAPRQGARVRSKSGGKWHDLDGNIDPSKAYEAHLPSGRSINLFFYDGPISQAVAFEGLLNSGESFANRLLSGFSDQRDGPQLVHIATDGESYGHHHRHGDMALAAALELIDSHEDVELTNYGEYLQKHPPTKQVEIVEDSSWSCVHGIGRWKEDCGCHTGGHAKWNQAWREPLRNALDWLRDCLIDRYEVAAAELLHDPWTARDDYIDVVLDRSPDHVRRWLNSHARTELDDQSCSRALKLLELQRHAMLMYTSCGWFFDDLSGIETVQVIQYAGRAVQLANDLFGDSIENDFLLQLSEAHSNIAHQGDGRTIYARHVRSTAIDLQKVAAHYSISILFDSEVDDSRVYCYDVQADIAHHYTAGQTSMHIGRASVTSAITWDTAQLGYMVLHLGEHIINGAVRHLDSVQPFDTFVPAAEAAFNQGDFTTLLRTMLLEFGPSNYTIASLFRDEQRRVIDLILQTTLNHIELNHRQIYERYEPLMRFLSTLDVPSPPALRVSAQFILNADIRDHLAADPPDMLRIRERIKEASDHNVTLDEVTIAYAAEHALERLGGQIAANPQDVALLAQLRDLVSVLQELPFDVDVSQLQNIFYELNLSHRPTVVDAAQRDNDTASLWLQVFEELGALLRVHVS